MTNLADLIEERTTLKAQNSTFNQRIKLNDERIAKIDQEINTFLLDSGLDSVKKNGYTAKREPKVGIKVQDWDEVFAYIIDNKATHFLRRQLLADPLKEMFEANEELPGAELYQYHKLMVRKTG